MMIKLFNVLYTTLKSFSFIIINEFIVRFCFETKILKHVNLDSRHLKFERQIHKVALEEVTRTWFSGRVSAEHHKQGIFWTTEVRNTEFKGSN